jgi:peptide/nickel transport system ATP-binding protein
VPALEITDLRIAIRGRPLLRGLTLSLQPGQRMALLGASGSGKSLTACAVIGQLPPVATAAGSIRVQGHEVVGVPTLRRPAQARVAMVFQDSSTALNPMSTIGRQLREPFVRQGQTTWQANRSAAGALDEVGLPDPERVLRRHPGALSGGQRQRVCLAIALACRTPVLVADEPTTALDVITQAAVIDLLRCHTGAAGGPALLFITHDIAVAAQLCDDIAVLEAGELVEHGPARQIVHQPHHAATSGLVAAALTVEGQRVAAHADPIDAGSPPVAARSDPVVNSR